MRIKLLTETYVQVNKKNENIRVHDNKTEYDHPNKKKLR